MTEFPDDELFERHAQLCQVLCNAKRQQILQFLEGDERTVTEIAERTGIAQPTVSQHLRKMRDKGVVAKRSEGSRSYYQIRDERIIDASMTLREVLIDILEEERSSAEI